MENEKGMVSGAVGAIGRRLVPALRGQYGSELVVAGYNNTPLTGVLAEGPSAKVDVTDMAALRLIIEKYNIKTIYHLAALLSIAAEKNPARAQEVNTTGFMNVLEAAREYGLKVFWPSSIAVFGPDAPKQDTPQDAPLNPVTVYGKGKVAGELQGKKYFEEYGVDFRSVRFPGLNDRLAEGEKPGPGTTEYAMDMIAAAKENRPYKSPLRADTMLPMMDMRDAIRAILGIMGAPAKNITIRTSYNLAAVSFTPAMLQAEIRRQVDRPGFKVSYDEIDQMKQGIADSWPDRIGGSVARRDWRWNLGGSVARRDWGWKHLYGLPEMVKHMLS
ncbi:NAD-dependent epimerase/dehydratase family protein [Candidatus Woesearchaeota archaeon]|nr:NAD-dependent epimerase/dehydratase family protein [Candidatus Woesearchaeota archaeon]